MCFENVKAYLDRLRKWEVDIVDDETYTLSFYLKTKYETKYFHLCHAKNPKLGETSEPRPMYHYYYCQFSEDDVPDGRTQRFISLYDAVWLQDEDDVTQWIKKRQRIGK